MDTPQTPSDGAEVDWQDVAKKAHVKMGMEIREGQWEAGCVLSRRNWDCDCTLICERRQLRVKCPRRQCTAAVWEANQSLAHASAVAIAAAGKEPR